MVSGLVKSGFCLKHDLRKEKELLGCMHDLDDWMNVYTCATSMDG